MAQGTINKSIILGRVGNDPDISQTPNGMFVANLSIATNESYKDKQTNQYIEQTEWHRVVVFGKQAETVQKYVTKGSLIYIEGKIKTEKWTDQQGIEKYTTKIIANNMQMIGGKSEHTAQPQEPPRPSLQSNSYAKAKGGKPLHDDFRDDSIPF